MLKSYINFLIAIVIVTLTVISCKKNDKSKNCGLGRVYSQGKCQCPEGKIERYQNYPDESTISCLDKNKGQYFIDSSNCPCYLKTKEFIMITEEKEIDEPSNWVNSMNAYLLNFNLGYNDAVAKQPFYYFKDQDSIYDPFFTISDFNTGDCDKDTRSFVTGKFFNNRNRLRLNVYFHSEQDGFGNFDNYTHSCTMWLNNHMSK